jgi:hypothetical protein
MRFAVIHCRNLACGQHIWVPEDKIGSRGRCPNCHHVLTTPAFVPESELFEGPHILISLDEVNDPVAPDRNRL